MRRLVLLALLILLAGSAVAFTPEVRLRTRAFVRPEPPPPITPVALTLPSAPAGTAAPILPRPSFIPTVAPVAPLTPTTAARDYRRRDHPGNTATTRHGRGAIYTVHAHPTLYEALEAGHGLFEGPLHL